MAGTPMSQACEIIMVRCNDFLLRSVVSVFPASDDSPAVADNAVYALSQIAYWVDGGDAVVDAGALQLLENFVQSSNSRVRRWTSEMLESLALHQSTSAALLGTNPCESFVKLLT
jgi:hypothetical protein